MNTSGQLRRDPPCTSGVARAAKPPKRQRGREIDLWLELLETLPSTPGGLDADVLADYLGVTPTAVYQYQTSAVTKLRSMASSKGLTVGDIRAGLALQGVFL